MGIVFAAIIGQGYFNPGSLARLAGEGDSSIVHLNNMLYSVQPHAGA